MKLKYIITVLGLLCLSWAHAQDDLSLADAIRLGLERNYDIRIENKNVLTAQNNNSWGEAGRMPTVNFNATSNNSLFNDDNGDQFFSGQTFPGFELKNQKNYAITPAVNANWVIFNGYKVNFDKQRLENLQLESEGNADIVLSNTVQAIILGYYLAVLEKERLDVFKQQLNLSSDKYEHVKIRSELGSAVSSDLLLEEGNYLNDSVNYINQQLSYRNAVRNFNFLLAQKEFDRQYSFTNSLEDEVAEYELQNLIEGIEERNIDLKKQYLSQAIIKNNLNITSADRYPRLTVDLGYNWRRSSQDLTSAEYTGPNPNFTVPSEAAINKRGTYFANFTLSYTLFNGNKINRAIKNAIIQEDIGNIRIEKLKVSVYKDLADNFDQYSIRKNIYDINVRRVEAAQTNLDISSDKFDNGSINSFDYRTVQNTHLNAAIQRLQSLYNLIDTKVTLMRLTGGIVTTYKN